MIVGSMVVKNEADRYLQASLTRLKEVCDQVFVFDDNSTDGSVEIAEQLGCAVFTNPGYAPTFLEDESSFRQSAWNIMGGEFLLDGDDWVISVDADEYFVGDADELIEYNSYYDSLRLHIQEVWSLDPLMIRTDGFWNQNRNLRIAMYSGNLKFNDKKMGCGSIPEGYAFPNSRSILKIFHFGYAEEADRQARYSRYKSLPDHGHNPKHIDSIITQPTLAEIHGVDFWRGVR